MKKYLFLLLTLALPVSIFLFLKIFGSNEFEVPVLFEKGIPDCNGNEEVHKVPGIALSNENGEKLSSTQLSDFLIFTKLDFHDNVKFQERLVQLVRIQDAFYETGTPKFILLCNEADRHSFEHAALGNAGWNKANYLTGYLHADQLHDFLRCGLGVNDQDSENNYDLVLVDTKKKIRGIYNGLDMEQTEQLILELKILKKQL